MPFVPQTYNRNLRLGKYYSTANSGAENYNPIITLYYNSNDDLIKIREEWRGDIYEQTISGSAFPDQVVSYTVTYSEWTTVSG